MPERRLLAVSPGGEVAMYRIWIPGSPHPIWGLPESGTKDCAHRQQPMALAPGNDRKGLETEHHDERLGCVLRLRPFDLRERPPSRCALCTAGRCDREPCPEPHRRRAGR